MEPTAYQHLGFRVLAEDGIGPELCALRQSEATHDLDPAIRVCMAAEADRDDPCSPARGHTEVPFWRSRTFADAVVLS